MDKNLIDDRFIIHSSIIIIYSRWRRRRINDDDGGGFVYWSLVTEVTAGLNCTHFSPELKRYTHASQFRDTQ